MKIVFTGGGTGGHFTPIIAIAERLNRLVDEEHLANTELYYFSDAPYDQEALDRNNMKFVSVPAGKLRLYFSLQNFIDIFKTGWGAMVALVKLFRIYPDVVMAKGGYASFPTLFAARILGIPVIIHESDSTPGRVGRWAGKFAKRIAVSYQEAAEYFDTEKVAWTGQPIREGLMQPLSEGAHEYLGLDSRVPTVFIVGGSLGAQIINQTVLEALSGLVENYQIIHQTGKANFEEVSFEADRRLEGSEFAYRYKPFAYLNELAVRMSAGIARVIVTRAGSMLFEIAQWEVPAIAIPITSSVGDHQRKNAYNYARTEGCVVIEEANLTPSVLSAEIDRIALDLDLQARMRAGAHMFSHDDAAEIIAREVLVLARSHEDA